MIHRKRSLDASSLIGVIFLVGCAAKGPSALTYSVRQVSDSDRDALLDAAEAAMVDLGYGIARRDAKAGVLISHPVSDEAPIADSLIGRALRNPARRVAEIQLRQDKSGWSVFCKVAVQEQSTEAHQLFVHERSSSDLPSETAIDRGAYATPEQSSLWRTVRRDSLEERALLAEITVRAGKMPHNPE